MFGVGEYRMSCRQFPRIFRNHYLSLTGQEGHQLRAPLFLFGTIQMPRLDTTFPRVPTEQGAPAGLRRPEVGAHRVNTEGY